MNRYTKRSVLLLVVILVLLAVAIYSGLQILESTVFKPQEEPAPSHTTKTIVRDGVEYFPRQDITVLMLMGIDRTGPVAASGSYNNPGHADMVALAIFDETAQEIRVLNLNRDTMMDIPILGVGGKPAGTMLGQLALAHTYGSGLEDSCENTRNAVSTFLGGIRIDYYLSMNMDAIGMINDAVGGVEVYVTDDFSKIDPTITKGAVVLNASQALNYLRTRQGLGDQLNLSRMERHGEYMNGFLGAFRLKLEENANFIYEEYEAISPYLVSDCSVNAMSGMMNRYADYRLVDIISPAGENNVTGEYMEYHVDPEQLAELVLDLFYASKK